MKIDPNQAVNFRAEMILCEGGQVALPGGETTRESELADPASAFHRWCAQLDPNQCFIQALIPADADRSVFFRARDVAEQIGVHMQAPVDTAQRLRTIWREYVRMKKDFPNAPQP